MQETTTRVWGVVPCRVASHWRGVARGALMLALVPSTSVLADTTVCTPITSVPFTAAQPGVYCLDRNLTAAAGASYAIQITSDDVSVDLNGYTLSGSNGSGTGITAQGVNRRNVTVRNGTVRAFAVGVWIGPGEGHYVERIAAEGNTHVGIFLHGRGSVRDCEVSRTGGSVVGGAFGAGIYGIGLYAQGSSATNNSVVDTGTDFDTVPAYGIYVWGARRSTIEGNRVGQATPYSQPNRKGIYLNGGSMVTVVGNRLVFLDVGIEYGPGGSSGPFRDNICTTCTTAYIGGTNAGNNY